VTAARAIFLGLILLGRVGEAQVTNTLVAVADAFLCTGSANYNNGQDLTGLNFGAAGTLVIAPPSSAKGEFQSVVQFDLSTVTDAFNSAYGSNNWAVTAVSLELTSNYGTGGVQPNNPIFPVITGGNFVIEWLQDNDWTEGTGTPSLPTTDGVTYDSLPTLLAGAHEPLCTNLYIPPGNNIPVTWPLPLTQNVLTNVNGASSITFLFYAADDQVCYLFNSYKYGRGNEPKIQVAATPRLTILSCAFTNDAFCLTGIGNNNAAYNIQASTNLASAQWLTIGSATADETGIIQFIDEDDNSHQQKFYRLSQ